MAFVTAYTKIFGEDNSVAGVVVLLTVMVFRSAIRESKPSRYGGYCHFACRSGRGAEADPYGAGGMGVFTGFCLFASFSTLMPQHYHGQSRHLGSGVSVAQK